MPEGAREKRAREVCQNEFFGIKISVRSTSFEGTIGITGTLDMVRMST